MSEQEWLTVEQFCAQHENIKPSTARQWAKERKLRAIKPGKFWLIHKDALAHFEATQSGEGA